MIRRFISILIVLVGTHAPFVSAAEPWADPALKVTSGLELWLDAAKLNAPRKSALKSGEAIDSWADASGNKRDLTQPAAAARPRLMQVADSWLVRFDGIDDHLRRTGIGQKLDAFTLFLVAAPHANPGEFRGFIAGNAREQRDYESGFTIDMSAPPSRQFEIINVEGRGFGGALDLLDVAVPFGTLHVIEATASPKDKAVKLLFDGKPAGSRPFAPESISIDELTLGARYYTNGPGAQQVRGFVNGEFAEVLLFNRVLSADESKQVRQYLQTKHAKLAEALPGVLKLPGTFPVAGSEPLVSVKNPPAVQMFVPGFTVKELPLAISNINNVKYRPDGTLVALAYDGNIYLLRDADGDGLEEKATLFWENKGRLRSPIGMTLTPPNYKHGNGVFVASMGKCSLIVDTDGDDKADKEIIVAEGWKELPHGVDALGVAFDARDGSVYFGLGTTDYTNAYQIDKDGKPHYRLDDERGTVLHVLPDFKKREIFCTGIRFPVGMAFNRDGDLFCTDQEGATWLPNGNPLDELLHLRKGLHYGFPPRHPKHLPNVIDEPSTFDYAPQHQSTCGINFNDLGFGPKIWAGDALVTGYSRGKLFRTQLVKTAAGYVARSQLLACLNMLPIDACVSPKGEMVIAVHSGGPDWGSGPTGMGKLYKITYSDKEHPQPVAVWANGPREVRVAFDRPLDPALLGGIAEKTRISFGEYVRAGDRFESLRPGYAVVQMQLDAPRFPLAVRGVSLTPDRRTLLITTDPMRWNVGYALTLPGFGRPARAKTGELQQHPQIDLDYMLTGVEATFQPKDKDATWSGWLPHPDLAVARAMTAGSATHDELWQAIRKPGTLTLRMRLNLFDMLRPAVQPGSRIDYQLPPEKVTISLSSPTLLSADNAAAAQRGKLQLQFNPKPGTTEPVTINLQAGGPPPQLQVAWHTGEDARDRPLPLHRILLPWAESKPPEKLVTAQRDIPELKNGSWARGREVFFSDQAGCAKCHAVNGRGQSIGPDLSNLVHRDYASVLRDVTEPSFAINPDFVSYSISLSDGRLLTGPIRTEGDTLLVANEKGEITRIRRADVEDMKPSRISVMPEGLPKQLGPDTMRDLLTFLLTEPMRMPDYGEGIPPPPRTRAEVRAVLAGAPQPPEKTRPLHIVLVAGRKDHGPGEHDYPAWQKAWRDLLAAGEQVRVTTANDWPSSDDLRTADVLVFYQQGTWTAQRAKDLDAFLARGGGAVYLHYAVDGGADSPGFAERIGLSWRGGQSRFRHGALDIEFPRGSKHPIARNFDKVHFYDESYWRLTGDLKRVEVLGSGKEDGEMQPLFWSREQGKGRVFVSILGHFAWTFDDPLFRILILRSIAWSAREPVDRFNELATIGARVADR